MGSVAGRWVPRHKWAFEWHASSQGRLPRIRQAWAAGRRRSAPGGGDEGGSRRAISPLHRQPLRVFSEAYQCGNSCQLAPLSHLRAARAVPRAPHHSTNPALHVMHAAGRQPRHVLYSRQRWSGQQFSG